MRPANDDARRQPGVEGNEDTERPDSAAKRASTLQARAALAGFELHRLGDGRWLASRWNLCRTLDDVEVEGWLQRVAGGAA